MFNVAAAAATAKKWKTRKRAATKWPILQWNTTDSIVFRQIHTQTTTAHTHIFIYIRTHSLSHGKCITRHWQNTANMPVCLPASQTDKHRYISNEHDHGHWLNEILPHHWHSFSGCMYGWMDGPGSCLSICPELWHIYTCIHTHIHTFVYFRNSIQLLATERSAVHFLHNINWCRRKHLREDEHQKQNRKERNHEIWMWEKCRNTINTNGPTGSWGEGGEHISALKYSVAFFRIFF